MKYCIINGLPGAGKDQFVEYVSQCAPHHFFVANISTVDLVKEVAKAAGWDGEKTPESRRFLSELKQVMTRWRDAPIEDVKKKIKKWIYEDCALYDVNEPGFVCFIHSREPEEIKRLKKEFNAITVLVRRPAVEYQYVSNSSDANVFEYSYDCTICNDGDLDQLKHQAEYFYNNIIKD